MKHKFLFPFVTAISLRTLLSLLAIVTGALHANAITINPISYGESRVEISAPNGQFAYSDTDREVFPVGDIKKFDHETQATFSNQDGTATSDATWTLKSNPNKTVYGGSYTLDATGRTQSLARIGTELSFTLFEPTSYSIAASFDASFDPFLDFNEFPFAGISVSLDRLVPFEYLELATDRNFAGGTVHLALGGSPLSGILEPGDYRFSFGGELAVSATTSFPLITSGSFGSGTGQFELSLDRLQGHVPDTGSTLALFGMAIAAIGGLRRISGWPSS
jgi:hypothetical protein